MRLKAFIITLLIMINGQNYSNADEAKSGINFYTGMFDFSDDKKRSTLFGIEHQDENLYRDTFLGRVSPVTGMMITADNATYFYTGVEANLDLGPFKLTQVSHQEFIVRAKEKIWDIRLSLKVKFNYQWI